MECSIKVELQTECVLAGKSNQNYNLLYESSQSSEIESLKTMITQVFLIFRQTANIYNKDTNQNRPCSSTYSIAGLNTTKRTLRKIQDCYDAAIQKQHGNKSNTNKKMHLSKSHASVQRCVKGKLLWLRVRPLKQYLGML